MRNHFAEKKDGRAGDELLAFSLQFVTTPSPAFAVIDGTLCQLNWHGERAAWHSPLATAIVEFRHGPMRVYVREHPYGLLPGIANLYCLDGALRLQWMAEWPDPTDPCARIVDEVDATLIVESVAGALVRLDAQNGRLVGVDHPMAAG